MVYVYKKYRVGQTEKQTFSLNIAAQTAVSGLEQLHDYLLDSGRQRLTAGVKLGATYNEMKTALEADEAGSYPGSGLYLVPWNCNAANEAKIKEECKATIRCYPIDSNSAEMVQGKTCFYSGKPATHMALFGRAF